MCRCVDAHSEGRALEGCGDVEGPVGESKIAVAKLASATLTISAMVDLRVVTPVFAVLISLIIQFVRLLVRGRARLPERWCPPPKPTLAPTPKFLELARCPSPTTLPLPLPLSKCLAWQRQGGRRGSRARLSIVVNHDNGHHSLRLSLNEPEAREEWTRPRRHLTTSRTRARVP
eukprot:scaffold130079_cov26-Tisochrysis_lutea.AAC.1